MSPDTVFTVANLAVIPAWLLLALLPQHAITQRMVHALWIPCLLACFYCWALFFGEPSAEGAGFGSLDALTLLFQSKTALLAGWIHYLAFDLFIGAWQVRDAARRSIKHLFVVPCLFFTLMAGPLGLMLYLLLRLGLRRVTTLVE
ncbi:MAG: ABA4-like family protein [Pseudomonadales bacterium]